MGLFDTVTNQAVVTTLNLSRKAEALVANNLANYDTPGYKTETLSEHAGCGNGRSQQCGTGVSDHYEHVRVTD
ncbi:flagellar basal body protein [Sulfobacillus thermotolerans]|uniref:flagellar basal body protein n=1 Tax=Sulfobacillus thermotolerans TaxID=338644 RepID=UPI0033670E0A